MRKNRRILNKKALYYEMDRRTSIPLNLTGMHILDKYMTVAIRL